MKAALQAFMNELIDYAGLFPPARLELDRAIRNFAGYQRQREAWMLGRFIAPANRLPELVPYGEEFNAAGGDPLRLSLLAGGGATAIEAMAVWRAEVETLSGFLQCDEPFVQVDAVETRLPADLAVAPDAADIADYLTDICRTLAAVCLHEIDLFVEASSPTAGVAREADVVTALAAFAAGPIVGTGSGVRRIGYKLRCGGVEPAAFPGVQRISEVLVACRDARLTLKCTAGLHHPVRHRATEPDVMMHGFVNVFGAGLLAFGSEIGGDELAECVAETAAQAFTFDDKAFRWRDRSVDAREIRRLRTDFLAGFGSCSFEDPRDDLRELGWM